MKFPLNAERRKWLAGLENGVHVALHHGTNRPLVLPVRIYTRGKTKQRVFILNGVEFSQAGNYSGFGDYAFGPVTPEVLAVIDAHDRRRQLARVDWNALPQAVVDEVHAKLKPLLWP